MPIAVGLRMGANDFTELVAWQLADQLERFALKMIEHPAISRDREFCEQTADAAGSATRNLAEGYGRFAPPQFGNFVRIAIGSEAETRNQIIKAWQRGALTDAQKAEGLVLYKRASSAAIKLRIYLDSPEAKSNAKRIEAIEQEKAKRRRDAKKEFET